MMMKSMAAAEADAAADCQGGTSLVTVCVNGSILIPAREVPRKCGGEAIDSNNKRIERPHPRSLSRAGERNRLLRSAEGRKTKKTQSWQPEEPSGHFLAF